MLRIWSFYLLMRFEAESAIKSNSRNACNDEGVSRSEVPTAEVNNPLPCNEANQFLAKVNEDKIEGDQAVAKTSEAVSFHYCTKLSESESLKPVELIPCDKRNYSTGNRHINEELRHPSPKQQRQVLEKLHVEDNEDCKPCDCNKTKCVGYCNCFSAGKYCVENCSCEECFNRPEYGNIVIGSKQLIEFRDPHAFDPKIIQHETEASAERSMDGIVSSSGRLKRLCNSTKSRCLKEYCERYLVELLEDKGSNRSIDEELRQSSPKQIRQEYKRLEELDAEDNVDCKHCKCKKFRCLKFACDCFAAGVDCTEACACEECFNRPESDDIINVARQEIEFLNRHPCATEPARPTHCSTLHATETSTERSMVGLLEDKGSNSNISGDLQQSRPKQIRQVLEELDVEDNDDSRRCHCTKTKCLKLDCDCFASGVHCAEACACQECFNRHEHDDKITDTRQQIESGKHEFAPKILQHASETSTKRSTVGVGCSDACGCYGCENKHGQHSWKKGIVELIP
ncbi:hypothetical protein LIER_10285 [Lithospermum erythrorhizon]|uniref:CRC domain-containing protein n=1 Tax=Lithospermum erythrorhizon TaxID=34254 RepID=A0AAV3PMQ8_LITER